jgi:hypothetical protein
MAMQKKRLLRLAELLEAHRDNGTRFDLSLWRRDYAGDGEDEWCGTKACAVGLACVDPKFKRAGLAWSSPFAAPKYKERIGWDAVVSFFGLENLQEASYLFEKGSYNGDMTGNVAARKVAKRIRAVVADGFPEGIGKLPIWKLNALYSAGF